MLKTFIQVPPVILLLVIALGGCTSVPLPIQTNAARDIPTSAEPGERVSLMIRSFVITKQTGGGEPEETAAAPEKEKLELQQCLVEELQQPRDDMIPIVAQPVTPVPGPMKAIASAGPAADLKIVVAAIPVLQSGTRYAVMVDAAHLLSDPKVVVLPLVVLGYFRNTRFEAFELKATIYDLGAGSSAGTARAASGGTTGTTAGYWGYAAAGLEHNYLDRARVCRELAIKIREFLAGKE